MGAVDEVFTGWRPCSDLVIFLVCVCVCVCVCVSGSGVYCLASFFSFWLSDCYAHTQHLFCNRLLSAGNLFPKLAKILYTMAFQMVRHHNPRVAIPYAIILRSLHPDHVFESTPRHPSHRRRFRQSPPISCTC